MLVTALDDVDRFDNARQVSAYIGLVPRQYQSGETDRNGRITKRGSRLLRTMLLECAGVSLRHNPWARATYDRIHGGQQTRKKKAAIALARKIAVVSWSMLSRGRCCLVVDVETRDGLGPPANGNRSATGNDCDTITERIAPAVTAYLKRTPLRLRILDRCTDVVITNAASGF